MIHRLLAEPSPLRCQHDPFAAPVASRGQRNISLRLQLLERRMDRLLRLMKTAADLALLRLPVIRPQIVQDPERTLRKPELFRNAAVELIVLLCNIVILF